VLVCPEKRTRPMKCACGKSFSTEAKLRRHTRLVHGAYQPYKCHICEKAFSKNSVLVNHIRRLHQIGAASYLFLYINSEILVFLQEGMIQSGSLKYNPSLFS